MKKILLIVGILVILLGIYPLMNYALDYSDLSNYGKGYIWGKLIIVIIGIVLIMVSRRLKK